MKAASQLLLIWILAVPLASGALAQDAPPPEETVKTMEPAVQTEAVSARAAPAPQSFVTMDTLQLDETSIIGNRELPKVLYIVPWKKANLGELVGRPVNSLLDEVLTPVDRDVFRRHISFYDDLHGEQAGAVED